MPAKLAKQQKGYFCKCIIVDVYGAILDWRLTYSSGRFLLALDITYI